MKHELRFGVFVWLVIVAGAVTMLTPYGEIPQDVCVGYLLYWGIMSVLHRFDRRFYESINRSLLQRVLLWGASSWCVLSTLHVI